MQYVDAKAYRGIGMEGPIAKWYAANTRKSMEDYQILARRMAGELRPGNSVLEVAPGPGYFAIELAKLGDFAVTGLDISQTFVQIARRNAAKACAEVDFQQGNVSDMPFAADSFDLLLCRAAFKNFADPLGALREMRRVLRPGGNAVIIDLRRDASPEAIDQMVDGLHLNGFSALMTRLTFRFMLLKRAYTKSEFEQLFTQAEFRVVDIGDTSTGLEMRLEK